MDTGVLPNLAMRRLAERLRIVAQDIIPAPGVVPDPNVMKALTVTVKVKRLYSVIRIFYDLDNLAMQRLEENLRIVA